MTEEEKQLQEAKDFQIKSGEIAQEILSVFDKDNGTTVTQGVYGCMLAAIALAYDEGKGLMISLEEFKSVAGDCYKAAYEMAVERKKEASCPAK